MTGDAPSDYCITIPAEPQRLADLHDLIGLARRDWPGVVERDFDLLETAVIELAGNVAQHGGATGATAVTVSMSVADDALEATVIDTGPPFDVDINSAELPSEMHEAGRGIAIARLALDDLTHTFAEGRNVWHLRRRRRSR